MKLCHFYPRLSIGTISHQPHDANKPQKHCCSVFLPKQRFHKSFLARKLFMSHSLSLKGFDLVLNRTINKLLISPLRNRKLKKKILALALLAAKSKLQYSHSPFKSFASCTSPFLFYSKSCHTNNLSLYFVS